MALVYYNHPHTQIRTNLINLYQSLLMRRLSFDTHVNPTRNPYMALPYTL